MNSDEIIRMADTAFDESSFTNAEVLRFAALVADAEREACAKVLDNWKKHNWTFEDCAAVIRARGNT